MTNRIAHPVTWGVVATLGIVSFGLWVGSLESCGVMGGCKTKFDAFLTGSPNEIGDTLAGFAGALAFIWIIVTVWLQSQELAEQREELRLTRLEMKEQREATQDMARSMSAQAKIFEDEARQRDETRARELFEELIKEVCKYLSENDSPEWKYLRERQDGTRTAGRQSFNFFFGKGLKPERKFELWTAHCIETVEGIISDYNKQRIEVFPCHRGYVAGLLRILGRMLNVRERLSEAQQVRFDALSVEDVFEALNSILYEHYWGAKE